MITDKQSSEYSEGNTGSFIHHRLIIACDPEKEPKMKIPDLKEEDIALLEKEIDRMNEGFRQ